MTAASESEEDCLVLGEGEACAEDGSSVREERLLKVCEGAEAMVSRSRSENGEGGYCIGVCSLDCRTRCVVGEVSSMTMFWFAASCKIWRAEAILPGVNTLTTSGTFPSLISHFTSLHFTSLHF
jgi:hypothetical protein